MCLVLPPLHEQQCNCNALLHLDRYKHCGRVRARMYLLHGSARSIAYLRHELNPLHPCCAGDAPCMASTQRAQFSAASCLALYRYTCGDMLSTALE